MPAKREAIRAARQAEERGRAAQPFSRSASRDTTAAVRSPVRADPTPKRSARTGPAAAPHDEGAPRAAARHDNRRRRGSERTAPLPPTSVLSLFGAIVALSLILLFGLDLAVAWPFSRVSVLFDVINVVCGAGLAFLSWDALSDQVKRRL